MTAERSRPGAKPRRAAWRRPGAGGDGAFAALTALAATLLLMPVLRLWRADLSAPLYSGEDVPFIRMIVKTVVNGGGFHHNAQLGAPFGQDLGEYPEIDVVSLALLNLLALFSSDADVVLNVFFLATFPLVAVAAFAAFRGLGISRPAAAVMAVVFAYLPYHFARNESHLFLAAYWAVPAIGYLMVALLRGDRLFERGRRGWLSRRTALTVATCVFVGVSWFYYAAYGLMLVATVGALAALVRRDVRTLAVTAVVVGTIAVAMVAAVTPYAVYQARHGTNDAYAGREEAESEVYSLKLMHLITPVPDHRIGRLARFTEHYSATAPPAPESRASRVGIVPALGLAGMLLALVGLALRGPPGWARYGPAGAAALVTFLFATNGGLGSLFGYTISAQLRGWNRLSVVLAFLALLAVGLALDQLRRGMRRAAVWPVLLVAIGAVAILDQTTPANVPAYAELERAEQSDAAYVAELERRLPAGAMVFQVPYVPFPASPPIGRLPWYDQVRGYLHSKDLRWSYGDVAGRAGEWRDDLMARRSPSAALRPLAAIGFAGVEVARRGYRDGGAEVERSLRRRLNVRPLVSADGDRAFFDMRAYNARVRRAAGAAGLAALRDATLHPNGRVPRRQPVPPVPPDMTP